MKKYFMVSCCVMLTVLLLCGSLVVLAAEKSPFVGAGEVHQGDFIGGGEIVAHEGQITGDLMAAGQNITVRGAVDGDALIGAYDISVSGPVGGSVRAAGYNVSLASTVNRNVTLFGYTVTVSKNAKINRNAYLFGNIIKLEGTVVGNTVVSGANVTLSGLYEGNVTLNDMSEGTVLNITPGTVIKGKLTYKGVNAFQVPSDVQVGSYEFVKINSASEVQVKPTYTPWNAVKKVFTMIIYYLIALLIYKLFPRFFIRSGEFIKAKPISATGIGIATLGSLVGGFLLLLILLILSVFVFEVSIFFYTGFVFTFLVILTVVFADIPVALWLGNCLRKHLSVPARLAIGLGLITFVKLILDILGNLGGLSTLVGVISFLLNAFIWVLGTGALLRSIFDIFKSANIQAEAEDAEIEPISF